jgi:hypothetical protein
MPAALPGKLERSWSASSMETPTFIKAGLMPAEYSVQSCMVEVRARLPSIADLALSQGVGVWGVCGVRLCGDGCVCVWGGGLQGIPLQAPRVLLQPI